MRSRTALVALGLTLSATRAGAVTDHLQCYKIVDATLHSLKGVVDVNVPSIGLAPGCKLTRAKLYCTAAEKTLVGGTLFNGTLPLTPLPYVGPASGTDRVCYGVRCPSPVRGGPDRTITDQFGTRALTRLRTSMLCTPAGTGAGYCGNGSFDPGEACDGTDLGGATCVGLGFASGVLACSASCVFDTVACEPTSGLDPTFGAGAAGFVVHGNAAGGDGDDSGNALSIDAAGRLVVAGHSLGSNGQLNMAVWRYAPSGALDTGFDGVGYASHAGAGGETIGTDVVIDASSRIVVAGYSIDTLGNWGMGIWRYNPDGTADASFNGSGFVRDTSLQSGGVGVALDTSGRIVVTGQSANAAGNPDLAVWRYNANGTLNTGLGGSSGVVTIGGSAGGTNGSDGGRGLRIDATGRLVVAGRSANPAGNLDMTIWRIAP